MLILRKKDTINLIVLLKHKNIIKLLFTKSYKRRFCFFLAGFMIDYREQVFMIQIKANMQYCFWHFILKERELVTESY